MDAEIEGDLSDDSRRADWPRRLSVLVDTLGREIDKAGIYKVVDRAPAADLLAKLSDRREVHACVACLQDVGARVGADRVLSAWVFRFSALVLSLHVQLRDVKTGQIMFQRALDYRGDNDAAWARATAYFVRELTNAPVAQR